MKTVGFGTLRLKPDEFWNITVTELVDMKQAVDKDEEDKHELSHMLLAWQTAHLMNATGNMKKSMTVEKLLGTNGDSPGSGSEVNRVDRDEKNKKLQDLKNKFKS